jgi:hypothetical protein
MRRKQIDPEQVNLTTQNSEINETLRPHYKYQHYWKRAVFRMKVHNAINWVNDEILQYGTSNAFVDINQNFKHNLDDIVWRKENKQEGFRTIHRDTEAKLPWYVISPDSSFSKYWSLVMSALLVYTAIIMPVRVAFYETVFFDAWTILDLCVDGLFLVDVGVNCFQTYENKEGVMETKLKQILKNYLTGWFCVDIIACFPFSLIEYGQNPNPNNTSGKYNQLVRLARVPRLYKLLRIFRIAKALKHYRNGEVFERIQDFLRMNSSEG